MSESDRRPLTTRSARWAAALARAISRAPITPNQISLVGIAFAVAGAALLVCRPTPWGFIAAAACVQLRLLCNMLDGMVAIEGGKQSPVGILYNEFPDRIEDALFLVALGHAAGCDALGWLMALLAALTAYIRVTGGSLGLAQDFRGPQAKPHRMAVMTATLLIAAAELHWRGSGLALLAGCGVIAAGTALTCARRVRAIAAQLQVRG